MPSVLFVCTANRFRSPVAAAMFKRKMEDLDSSGDWYISSAGTWAEAGLPVISSITDITRKIGLDLAAHRSVGVSRQLLSDYDLILTMEAGQKEALLSEFPHLKHRVHLLSYVVEHRSYDIPDTLDSREEAEKIVVELNSLVQRGYDNIRILAINLSHIRRVVQS